MRLFLKIGIGIFGLIIITGLIAWIYFGAGEETYPQGLSKGSLVPMFVGADQYGNKVSLEELNTENKVVLVFFRGTWCPICNQYISQLQDSLQMLEAKGTKVLTVTSEKPEFLGENNFKRSIDIPVIYDSDLSIMNSYNVAYELSKGSKRIYNMAGIDFSELTSDPGKLPVPAIFIIGRDGKIEYSAINEGGLQIQYSTVREILESL